MSRRPRTDPKERDGEILQAAIDVALTEGYQWITRTLIAERARMAPATVSLWQSKAGMVALKRAVLHEAVAREILPIIAQGIADNHPIVQAAPRAVRQRALEALGA